MSQVQVVASQKMLAEFLGTFGLVFFGTGVIVVSQETELFGHALVALVWGLAVTIMIYAFGPISGAHINPAVTFAFLLDKRIDGPTALLYIVAQLLGAAAASFAVYLCYSNNEFLGATMPNIGVWKTFVLEAFMTFLLVYVVFTVAVYRSNYSQVAGIIIGFVVLMEAAVAGPATGASMNPARSFGPALVSGYWEYQWIYWLAPITGGVLGYYCSKLLSKK